MNINDIQDLIKFVAKAGVNEVEIEKKDFKIVIKSDYMAKKKTNFKEEPTIVQQQLPVGNIAAQPIAAAPAPAAAPAASPSELCRSGVWTFGRKNHKLGPERHQSIWARPALGRPHSRGPSAWL